MTVGEEVQERNLSIAVVGTTSTGKSTFVNALCGRYILPVGVRKTTTYITEITHTPNGDDISIQTSPRGSYEKFSSDSLARNHLRCFQKEIRTSAFQPHKANRTQVQANVVSDFMNRIQFDHNDRGPSQSISLKFIDLPGYSYKGDDLQEKDILEGVENAFITFLFSAEETDSTKEEALIRIIFEHLKCKCQKWQNVFFILNRCDAFDRDGNSTKCLNQKIQKLQAQITSIKNNIFEQCDDYTIAKPVVHPLSTLPVMYSQVLFWNYDKISNEEKEHLLSKACLLKNAFLSNEKAANFPRTPLQWNFEHVREYRNEIMRSSKFDEFLFSFAQHIKEFQT